MSQASKWMQTRAAWKKANPQESFTCYYCGRWLARNQITLDHLLPRSTHPALRHELTNLVVCCWPCNAAKGSQSAERFKKNLRNI